MVVWMGAYNAGSASESLRFDPGFRKVLNNNGKVGVLLFIHLFMRLHLPLPPQILLPPQPLRLGIVDTR